MNYPILGCPILTHSLNVLIWSDFQATLGRDFPTNRAELVRGCWKVIFRNHQGHPTTFSGLKNHGFAVKHRCFSKKNRHFSTMIVFRINLSMFFQEKQAPFFCWSWMAMEKSHCHRWLLEGIWPTNGGRNISEVGALENSGCCWRWSFLRSWKHQPRSSWFHLHLCYKWQQFSWFFERLKSSPKVDHCFKSIKILFFDYLYALNQPPNVCNIFRIKSQLLLIFIS